MGVPQSGPGMLKFITIALYVMVLFGIIVNVINGIIIWNRDGEWKPLADSTLGQIVYWDNQIYEGVASLKDDQFIGSLPDGFQEQYKDFVVKQIVFNVMLFVITGYFLYKLGNWIMGRASFDPTTDLIIIAVIILVIFPFAEFMYGWLMHKEIHAPYRGVVEIVKPSTWEILISGVKPVDIGLMYNDTTTYTPYNSTTMINLSGEE